MKYQCDIPGLEHCFWQLSDRWSTKQVIDFWDDTQAPADYHALICKKTEAIYLECIDQPPITQPVALDKTAVEAIDRRLLEWVRGVPLRHVKGLGDLGEASRLRLFGITAANLAQDSDHQEP